MFCVSGAWRDVWIRRADWRGMRRRGCFVLERTFLRRGCFSRSVFIQICASNWDLDGCMRYIRRYTVQVKPEIGCGFGRGCASEVLLLASGPPVAGRLAEREADDI